MSMHLALAELLFVLLSTVVLPLLPGSAIATATAGVVVVVSLSTVLVGVGGVVVVVVEGVAVVVVVANPGLRGSVAEIVLLIDGLIRENRFGGTLVYEPLPVFIVEVE